MPDARAHVGRDTARRVVPLFRPYRAQVAIVVGLFALFLVVFQVYDVLAPTLLVAGLMFYSAADRPAPGRLHRWLTARPLSFWIMSWFLFQSAVLTLLGTFFRGPGWSFVMPWSGQI